MFGASIKRIEDRRLLTGGGAYSDDIKRAGSAHAAFLRSPHAHAEIVAVDPGPALARPGVLGVFAHDDLAATGAARLATGVSGRAEGYPNRDGSVMADPPFFALATGRVRHVGEAVALVVAESAALATEAAEAVAVAYRPLPAAVGAARALAADAPQLWPEAPCNICYDWAAGDGEDVAAALAAARHVAVLETAIGRVVPAFLEPRAALAAYDAASGRFELIAGCQSIHGLRDKLAQALGVGAERLRVISPDVGGAFGARSVVYPEYLGLLWAARALGRPVRWTATRSEEFLATTQGRDGVLKGELGLDGDGRFTALRVTGVADMGARHTGNGPYSVMRNLARMLPGVYAIPAARLELKGVFTNTVPVSSYRGVGRMEANFMLERLIDRAAREIGADRVELRRRNLIAAAELPRATAMDAIYDSGDYAANMDKALAAADWDGFPARRAAAARAGRLRGIGLSNYIEGAGGGAGEYAGLAVDGRGRIRVAAGCVDQGQGQRTTLAQIAADRLGLALDRIEVLVSDTDLIADGVGTNASRSMVRAGAALAAAAGRLIEEARGRAALLLQARPEELSWRDGRFEAGDGRGLGLDDVARAAAESGDGLAAHCRSEDEAVTYPNGCHVCEVEVDPETGAVAVVAFTAVDDVGRAVNPTIVRGQSQGGIAQGIGQALLESGAVDLASGQVVAGSLLDYALPRARGLPRLEPIANDVPSPTNVLGVKGAGEGGATGAPAAVVNAVLDALAPLGVADIVMPATPARVWRAIRDAAKRG